MSWIGANLILLAIVLLFAGLMFGVAFVLRFLGFEPDDYPAISTALVAAALFVGYFIAKRVFGYLSRR